MGISDYMAWVHGKATPTVGVDIGHSGSEYSEDELDTERTTPGIGATGDIGLHMLVNEVFNTLTSVDLRIAHGAATSPTTILTSRNILLAALVAGAHFYLPIPPGNQLLRYVRGYVGVNGSNPSTGQVCMWFGPKDGSENA